MDDEAFDRIYEAGAQSGHSERIAELEAALAAKDAEIEKLREAMLAEHQRAEAAIATERERCARVAEAHRHQQWRDDEVAESVKTQVADAIRAG